MQKVFMIYIDFDDTMYDHKYHWRFDEDFDYNIMFGFGKIPYEEKYLNHELVAKVKNIIEENKKKGIKTLVNLLTGCRTSVYFVSKTNFLDEVVPKFFDQYFSVSSQEDKLPMIQAYNKKIEEEYEIVNTLVIDDSFGVTAQCQDVDYEAMAPGYFEKHYELGE
ncbi:MAG: hypothetical protein BWY21_02254 [Parcubacteria group bacterium ADurb.Bin216]|nr:MAG: hypothetical protein BWY21_02254 [Parcubacteria group bacterium ADurb.Bin216]